MSAISASITTKTNQEKAKSNSKLDAETSLTGLYAKISEELSMLIKSLQDKTIKNLEEDGVEVDKAKNGCNHEVVHGDDYSVIRILRVTAKKGKKEFFHAHELPAVMFIYQAAKLKMFHKPNDATENPTPFDAQLGVQRFIPFEGQHAVENVDPTRDFGAFRFELRKEINDEATQTQLVSTVDKFKVQLMKAGNISAVK